MIDPIQPILPQVPNIPPVAPAPRTAAVDPDGGRQGDAEGRGRGRRRRAVPEPSPEGDPTGLIAPEDTGPHIDITA